MADVATPYEAALRGRARARAPGILAFVGFSVREILHGPPLYYAWLGFLACLIAIGAAGVMDQTLHGHIVTAMRDPVPWGVFIGTYAFFVGVAAAAVALVVPGYIYRWGPIEEIVVLGEIMAISAVVMCILFVMADLGHPERFWHLLPGAGLPNVPSSMIACNVLILNGYLILNAVIVTSTLYRAFTGKPRDEHLFTVLVIIAIPAAISIHATTAFIFNVLPARPYWNTAILVPRFIATALTAGPALMVVVFQTLRWLAGVTIRREALFKIGEMMAIVMFVNLLLMIAEVLTEYRSATHHVVHVQYYFEGAHGSAGLSGWAWFAVACDLVGFTLLVIPATRKRIPTLLLACALVFTGVFIEKGIGLILPGFVPGLLGEMYDYQPSWVEIMIATGVAGAGALLFTLMTKVAIPLELSPHRPGRRHGVAP